MPTEPYFRVPPAPTAPTAPPTESSAPPDSPPGQRKSTVNAVFLSGTLTEPAEERELAGGIKVVRWTLRVSRGPGRVGTDLIDCVALDEALHVRALHWTPGGAMSVEGAIRRRFFRTGGRTTTRVEVEAHVVTEHGEDDTSQVAQA